MSPKGDKSFLEHEWKYDLWDSNDPLYIFIYILFSRDEQRDRQAGV